MTELDFGESSLEYICPVSPLREYYSYVYIYMMYPVSPPVTWFWWVLVGIYKSGESFTIRYWNTTYIFPVCPQSSSDLLRHNILELPSSPRITKAHPILRCLSERTHWIYIYVVFPWRTHPTYKFPWGLTEISWPRGLTGNIYVVFP
jgi:hypothetical protein